MKVMEVATVVDPQTSGAKATAAAAVAAAVATIAQLKATKVAAAAASRSTTEEEDFEYFSNYHCLFRTRMPMLRRQDSL
jgi:3-oxoacyl-(acyl-carrier-protein) synthase